MLKIFVTRKIMDNGLKKLRDAGLDVTVSDKDRPLEKKELLNIFKKNKYDAVLTLLTDQIDKDVLDVMAPSVKIISQYAVGFDNIDVEYAKQKGIIVANTPATSSDEVAEHTVSLMLALNSNVLQMDTYVRDGKYKGWDPLLLRGPSLAGKTLGIVGSGKIGEYVARICHWGLKMKIIYFDISRNAKIESALKAEFVDDLDDLLKQSDAVSLHVPLNAHTHHLIDLRRLSLMKKDALLINTSRGPVIDENALVEVLQKKQIRGAALDVFEFEPKLAKGLEKLKNVVLSPHVSSATERNRQDMAVLCTQNIIEYFKGHSVKNQIN